MAAKSGWAIGKLAKHAGVSAGTLRHYDALGLLTPSDVTPAGYRLYNERDRARLDLIRALRALELGLETIQQLLSGTVSAAQVAQLHLRTLDFQFRVLGRRRAVLHVLLSGNAPASAARLARLQVLATFESREREQFLSAELDARLKGSTPSALHRWIRNASQFELPDNPSEAQVEAWLELAEMVSDPTFLVRYKRAPTASPSEARLFPSEPAKMLALFQPAAAAATNGTAPDSAAGQQVVRAWVRALARARGRRDVRAFASVLLNSIDAQPDKRESRFWELIAVLRAETQRSPIAVGWPWLVAGLRAWLSRYATTDRASTAR